MEKDILKPMYCHRKMGYKIVRKIKTSGGGWRSFGSGRVYLSKQACQDKINWLVANNPDTYQNELTPALKGDLKTTFEVPTSSL